MLGASHGACTEHFSLFSCEDYPLDLPDRHPFPNRKYPQLEALLVEAGFGPFLRRVGEAPRALLQTVHGAAYLDRVFGSAGTKLSTAELRRVGFPWGPGYLSRALASVEATFQAMLTVLTLGGGYQKDHVAVARAHAQTYVTAAQVRIIENRKVTEREKA